MIIELSVIFAFLAMICWGFGDFFIQKCTRKIGDLESLAYIGIVGIVVLIPFIIKDFNTIFNSKNLIMLGVLGIITFIAAILDFEALKKGKLSIIDVILEIELPLTIALGFIFLKESLSPLQFLFVFLILIGIIFTATKSFSHWKTKLEKGVIFAIFAAIVMSFVNFLTGISAREVSPLMAIWIPWIIFSIISFSIIIKRKKAKKFIKDGFRFKSIIIPMAILDTAAWIFYAFAMVKEEISIITAITESYPALALFLGVWFNKEKIRWYQYLGAAMAICASIILGLSV